MIFRPFNKDIIISKTQTHSKIPVLLCYVTIYVTAYRTRAK